MSELKVESIQVPGILEKMASNEWMMPYFQRDFVWSTASVTQLILSIIDAQPIGMATLWEQEDHSPLQLEPVSVADRNEEDNSNRKFFSDPSVKASRRFAVLDGRQRCTAIAMAFGGLKTEKKSRFWGRYFLNVEATDPTERVIFIKEPDVKRKSYDVDNACIPAGLFPLTSNISGEGILQQWMRYLQAIRDPANYPDGKLPSTEVLHRRNKILQDAFGGINGTKLAVYTVPKTYGLGKICEIFETLNTTGTKVSTVDLIHSWLYSETAADGPKAIRLRDWIDDLGELPGAIGWADTTDRPELIAQIVTACYVALESKPEPRRISGSDIKISSVKADDLLATPLLHWRNVIANDERLACILGEFQDLVGGGRFPHSLCPYPVSAAIYVSLRWHETFDDASTHQWSKADLDALFRAFFWRNALANRYDQGFLTQIGTDIRELKNILAQRKEAQSGSAWAQRADTALKELIREVIPTHSQLVDLLTTGRLTGATQRAMLLPMLAGVRRDFVNPGLDISYPKATSRQVHHIYPKDWCRNNRSGELREILDPKRADRDWCESVANLTPLDRTTNAVWKSKIPGQYLHEQDLSFQNLSNVLDPIFIDSEGFSDLLNGKDGMEKFWTHRAKLMADDLCVRMTVHY